jgi:hypothetical protein
VTVSEFIDALRCFTPTVKLIEGCYVRASDDSVNVEYIRRWMDELGGDRRAVEAMVNHVHLISLVYCLDGDYSAEDLAVISDVYTASLDQILRRSFPDVTFTISVEGLEDASSDPGEVIATFWANESARTIV